MNSGYTVKYVKLHSLFDILRIAREKHPKFGRSMAEAEAVSRWDIAVGPLIAKHARAVRVSDSILWVEVEHPIWRAELHYRKRQILDILNGVSPCANSKLSPAKEVLSDICYLKSNTPTNPVRRGRRKSPPRK